MKLTKFVALLLCSLLMCLTFVGCGNKEGYTDYDWQPTVEVALEYDLYIFNDRITLSPTSCYRQKNGRQRPHYGYALKR